MAKVVSSFFSGLLPRALTSAVNVDSDVRQPIEIRPFRNRVITMEEVSWHDTAKDCWIIVYDRVYDVTNFLEEHPGGGDLLLEYAGREASGAFRGAGHSLDAIRNLEQYCIGELPVSERIFRKPDGLSLRNIPE